jgi:DNA-binding MarR family transcriptional regulator
MVAADPALGSALRIAVMRLSRRMRQERDEASPSPTQLATLATLERQGPLPLRELAALERVQPPSVTRTVAALVAAGLAVRTRHPGDGRQALVAVTAEGRARLAAERRRRDEWLAARLRLLPDDDLDALLRALPVLERLAEA